MYISNQTQHIYSFFNTNFITHKKCFIFATVKLRIRHIATILVSVFFAILLQNSVFAPQKVNIPEYNSADIQDKQFAFEAPDYSVTGSGYEQVRIPVQFSNLHLRRTGNSDFLRNLHFSNCVEKQFGISLITYLKKSSLKESSGYYLYHLRKLLI